VLEKFPNEAETMNNKASILFKMKNYEASYLCFKAATDINPENPIIWSNMGKVLFKLNRRDEAMSCWEISFFLSSRISWDDHIKYVFLGALDSDSYFAAIPRPCMLNLLQCMLGIEYDVGS
jgi:tetratricopeptide (TPR) repeat protein